MDEWERFACDVERILASTLRRMDAHGLTRTRVAVEREAEQARQSIRDRAA